MSVLDRLIACAGPWRGTSRLQDPHIGKPDDSPSTATVTPVLGGRFVRLDYTWAYHGEPQEGSILFGQGPAAGEVTAHWIDSWHNGNVVMACRGTAEDDGSGSTLSVRGHYAAPPGPDWGWRNVVTADDDGRRLRIVMYNVTPDGSVEELAVEGDYVRAQAGGPSDEPG